MLDDDELAQLRSELDDARAQLARHRADDERRQLQDLAAAAEHERLRAEAAAAADAAAAFDADVTALRDELDRTDARLRDATSRYREAVLAAEPWLTPDLVAGETVEEIDAALERARTIAVRLREDAAAQLQAARVPVGAPARGGPDVSRMTAEEKIRYGLAQRGSQ